MEADHVHELPKAETEQRRAEQPPPVAEATPPRARQSSHRPSAAMA
jgi:hypothetical protein